MSSVTTAGTVGRMSKRARLPAFPDAANPASSAGANTSSPRYGEYQKGSHPSAISAARATFLGPIAAR
jgi:hypothetical protein